MGTQLPFERAADLLARVNGVTVSAASVRRVTEGVGREMAAVAARTVTRLARELPPAPRGAPRQLLSVDGAMVPLVGGEWREVKLAAFGTLTTTRTGEVHARDLSYVAAMADVTSFSHALIGEAHRRGLEHAAVVAAVTDGAAWCQQVIDDHAPHATRILDFPHAVGHLSEVAEAVFGPAAPTAATWLARQRDALREGAPDAVLAALADLPVRGAADPAVARATRDRVLAYLASRRAHIAYATFRSQALPIGSGAVESGNKLVVEARLKGAGMHWAPANIAPMLALRATSCSGRWDETWDSVRAIRRRPRQPSRPLAPVIPPPDPPLPLPAIPPPPVATRPKTIVNGRPTADHPWKRGLSRPSRPQATPIPKI